MPTNDVAMTARLDSTECSDLSRAQERLERAIRALGVLARQAVDVQTLDGHQARRVVELVDDARHALQVFVSFGEEEEEGPIT